MPRYIDAELAEKEITSLVAEYENRMPEWWSDDMLTSGKDAAMKYGYKADGAEKALEIVNKTPTADVQEVRHGHWRELSAHRDDDGYIVHDYECTCCFGIERDVPDVENSELEELDRYCPMCGAKMDGGKG